MWGPDFGLMLVIDLKDNRILGSICHFKPIHYYDALELGYILFRPEDRGKGYMTEALRLFSAYLFDCKTIFRLQVQAEPGNIGSRRIAEKCGYQFEGVARSAFISQGVPSDINVFSLIRSDLLKE